uniref:Ig-like domain-containing protein n=1 Tax=Mola mola TaxID=94237 RepID=A0A3Q3WF77_MOLML
MPLVLEMSLIFGLVVRYFAANLEVNMEDRVEVFRGETAQITCMFTSSEGIGGLIIKMFYEKRSGEKQQIYFQDSTMKEVQRGTPFSDRISVNGTGATRQLVLTIRDVQLEDQVEFICLIEGLTEGVGEGRTRLKVFDPPTIESDQKVISIDENNPSKIGTCEVKNGFPEPNITWYRNDIPLRADQDVVKIVPSITTESSGLFSVTSELFMKVVKADKDDEFYCEVTYFLPGETRMTETNRINITVHYPPTAVSVWVESPKGKIKEGDLVELHCQGNGNSPFEITITHENVGVVMLKNVTRLDSGVYKCVYADMSYFEEITANTTVFVNYLDPAVVKPAAATVVSQGDELRATCNALSSLQTDTVWLKNGEMVSKGHSLILSGATYDMAGMYECLVTVPEIEGMETRGTLLLNVQGRPEIRERDNTEIEENFESTVNLSCNVIGVPAPSITWTTSDGKVLEATSQRETEEGVQSMLSLKVTSDITAFCNASNNFGTDAVTFNIKTSEFLPLLAFPVFALCVYVSVYPHPLSLPLSSPTPQPTPLLTPPTKVRPESLWGSGVIIAVIVICILLLAILGSVLYFLYKKGKICGRSGKQDFTKEKSNKDNIVVEMKSDSTEDTVLLGVNGEKQPPSD